METVTSRDGTTIAYWRSGHGAPVVLVHGSISDRTAWALVQPALERRFTVYAVNRRGREGSDAPEGHTMTQEFEDVASVVDAIGEPVHLVGHSFGAVCSIEATRLTGNVRSLVLYEPPMLGNVGRDVTGGIRALAHAGRDEDILIAFLRQGLGLSEKEMEAVRRSELWPNLVAHAASLAGELEASADYRFDPSRFAELTIPVLLLVGGESPPRGREVNEALAQVLPNARQRSLPGQRHLANLSAPDLLASEILRFLEEV